MEIHSGSSGASDGEDAVAEATKGWPASCSPDLILAFHSTRQNASQVARALQQRFPNAQIAGCTTAGEHLDGEHYNGHLVLSALTTPEIRWQAELIEDIATLDAARAHWISDKMLSGLAIDRDDIDPDRHFALCLIDGLSCLEEKVAALMAEAFGGMPFLGGSAGDDLHFKQTDVFANGISATGAAVFILATSSVPFQVIKHQHFVKTPAQLVITRCDLATRRVFEMDGKPAAQAYAEALGLAAEDVTPEVCFANPVLFRVQNEIYVRSIQKIEADQSIVFYCGVEEGMVVEIGSHEAMDITLARDCGRVRGQIADAELFIGYNCILRALESETANNHHILGGLLRGMARHMISFDTYGEQLNGMHINQTLVGIVFGRKAA